MPSRITDNYRLQIEVDTQEQAEDLLQILEESNDVTCDFKAYIIPLEIEDA